MFNWFKRLVERAASNEAFRKLHERIEALEAENLKLRRVEQDLRLNFNVKPFGHIKDLEEQLATARARNKKLEARETHWATVEAQAAKSKARFKAQNQRDQLLLVALRERVGDATFLDISSKVQAGNEGEATCK